MVPINTISPPMNTALRAFILLIVIEVVFAFAFPSSKAHAQELGFNSGGGPISLTVLSAAAGAEPQDAIDSSTEIYWDANFGVPAKLTVNTISFSQSFDLYVLLNVPIQGLGGQGVVQPEIQLFDGMLDTDILTDIPSTLPGRQGFGTLRYRAAATVADGNSTEHGDDSHIVTFTLLAQ